MAVIGLAALSAVLTVVAAHGACADAIPSAAHYLHALLARTDGNLRAAILAYNHSPAYVSDVLARARAYARESDVALAGVAGDSLALTAPRWWSIVASSCSRWTSTGRASDTAERGEKGWRPGGSKAFRALPDTERPRDQGVEG